MRLLPIVGASIISPQPTTLIMPALAIVTGLFNRSQRSVDDSGKFLGAAVPLFLQACRPQSQG